MIHGLLFCTIHKIFQRVSCFQKVSSVNLPLKKRCMQSRWYLASSAGRHLVYWLFEGTSSDRGSICPSQNVFNVLRSLHLFVAISIQLMVVIWFAVPSGRLLANSKSGSSQIRQYSVIVWTFTSCRFSECCVAATSSFPNLFRLSVYFL